MTIAIVDYGAGNLTSVKKALDSLGSRAIITSDAEQISGADKLIVPGVGHFAATAALQRNGMLAAIQAAIRHETPLLGICLGMQWLCAASTEAPDLAGLNIFAADCTHFPSQVKAPHVGWNDLEVIRESGLLTGTGDHDRNDVAGALSVGAARNLARGMGMTLSLGAQGTLYAMPTVLRATHGTHPISLQLFLRLGAPPGGIGMASGR